MSGRAATINVIPGSFALSVGLAGMPAPRGWQWVSLTEVARLESGHTPSRLHPEYWEGGIPWISIKDARAHHGAVIKETHQTVTQAGLDNSAARLLPASTVCLSRTASVGYVVVMGRAMATSQDFVNWICGSALEPHFLKLLLIAENQSLFRFGKGSTHTTIYYPEVKAFHVCLPPPNEQRRIVAKLEALQARSRRAREALDAVPPLLEKLSQSILAAAFRGDLTKDWRAKHKDVEPASELLKRIRTERRKKWEESEIAKLKAKGRTPTDDKWKAKYKEPLPVDAAALPALPEGWCWAPLPTLGELARGKSKHRPRNDPALFGSVIPFIQTGEVARSDGRITSHSAMYSAFGVAQSRVFPRGTVCITIAANIADTGILDFDACFPDSVVGLVADSGPVVACYVELFIRTARVDLRRFAPATAQANINLEVLGEVAVPIPPHEEMVLLVERVEQAMAKVRTAASSHGSAAAQLQTLERSQLAKAFRGELVPQEPDDEPAEVMLSRVRGDLVSSQAQARRRPPSAGERNVGRMAR